MRRRLAEALQPANLRECVVCGDVPEDPVVSVCSHIYCSECFGAELSKAGQGAAGERLRGVADVRVVGRAHFASEWLGEGGYQ